MSTYNERENVLELARSLLGLSPPVDVCFVYDDSPDGTGAVLDGLAAREPRIHVLHRPDRLGLGTAYLAGFRLREVPIIFRGRHSGTSKISRGIVLEALVRVWGFRLRRWLRRRAA